MSERMLVRNPESERSDVGIRNARANRADDHETARQRSSEIRAGGNRAPLLHTAIVAAADDASAVHQHRSDRDAALCPPFFRLLDGGAQKLIGHQWPRSYSSPRAKTDGASGSIAARSRGFDRQIRRS